MCFDAIALLDTYYDHGWENIERHQMLSLFSVFEYNTGDVRWSSGFFVHSSNILYVRYLKYAALSAGVSRVTEPSHEILKNLCSF